MDSTSAEVHNPGSANGVKSAATTRTAKEPLVTDVDGEIQNVGLDQLLAEAANAESKFVPGAEFLKAAGLLARQPGWVVGKASSLVSDLARVGAGQSERTPPKGGFVGQCPANSLILTSTLDISKSVVDVNTYEETAFIQLWRQGSASVHCQPVMQLSKPCEEGSDP